MRMFGLRLFGVSKFGTITVFFFLIYSLLGRFLFPLGDEPDFTSRAIRLVEGAHHWWSPYYWCSPLLKKMVVSPNCIVDAAPFSFWVHIDSSCIESPDQILFRFILGVFVASPLLIVLILRRSFAPFVANIGLKLSSQEWNQRLDSMGLSLIIPGMTYYMGVLSHEQFTLVLSLFVFIFWGNWVVVFGLVALISMIDLGNSVVVVTFICFSWLSFSIAKLFSIKASLLAMIFLVFFAYIFGFTFLTYVENIPGLAAKAQAMLNKSESGSFAEKYPVILRPVITFMTASFMTPSGIKVVPVYLILGGGGLVSIWKIVAAYIVQNHSVRPCKEGIPRSFQGEVILALSALTTVLFFVFMFPDYANAKYYIFLAPFIIMVTLSVSSKYNVLIINVFCASVVSFTLLLYRL